MKVSKSKKQVYSSIVSNTSLFDKFYDIIVVLDSDSKIIYGNKAFSAFINLDKKSFVENKTLLQCMQIQNEESKPIDPMAQCMESKKSIGLREVKAILNNNEECSLQLGIKPLFETEESETIKGFLVNIEDKSLEYNLHVKYRKTIEKIEEDFNESVKIFANITDMIDHKSDLSVKMSSLALKIAKHLNLKEKDCREISVAARLRNIGTLGMNPEMLEKNINAMSKLEKNEYEKFPILGPLIFEGIPAFENICSYVQTHQEHVDGKGFPLGLEGEDIPLGGNIICLVNDFYNLEGSDDDQNSIRKKVENIQKYQDIKYHAIIIDAFLGVISDKSIFKQKMERKNIGIEELKTGMLLAENLFSSKGILLLQADERISVSALRRIHRFHENDPITQKVQIYQAVDTAILSKRIVENKKIVKKILVVDDTQDLNMLICMMINRNAHYTAEGVHDGKNALEKISKNKYDLYLLDIMMPGMSGIELLDKIRKSGDKTPVIMCTAKSGQADVVEAFKTGADDYLIKPVVQETLLKGLGKVLDYQQSSEGLVPDFKAYRSKQMLEVLKTAAPEALLKNESSISDFEIQYKYTSDTKAKAQFADAHKISKIGFLMQAKSEIKCSEKIVFSLIQKSLKKVLLVGMANIVSEGEKEFSYNIEFINVRKR